MPTSATPRRAGGRSPAPQAVVHLAAIVGDPACALDPAVADEVNVQATRALVADANEAGVQRLVFASTCSNYGRMADPNVPITEEGELRPVSLYAEQKVGMEQLILGMANGTAPAPRAPRQPSPPACASPPSTASDGGCAST